jgi:hypothetical protein
MTTLAALLVQFGPLVAIGLMVNSRRMPWYEARGFLGVGLAATGASTFLGAKLLGLPAFASTTAMHGTDAIRMAIIVSASGLILMVAALSIARLKTR